MRLAGFTFLCLSVVIVSVLGCATFGGGQISGINWALARNGGRVSAFAEDPDHPASTLINGITSSEGWDQGEGWQAVFTLTPGGGRRSGRAKREELERNWVIVELAQPVTVNRVKIYTVDSEKYPAKDFGVNSLLVQYETETALKEKLWVSVERYGKGVGEQDNAIRNNTGGVIDVKFKPVTTRRIRVLILRTNDLKRAGDGSKTMQGTIRLTEIEVYGTGRQGKRDELEKLFEE